MIDFGFSARALRSTDDVEVGFSTAEDAVDKDGAAQPARALTDAGVEVADLDGEVTKLRPTGTLGLAGSSPH